jgi:SepF-like predicted cell division protein (DUF552 family)
MSPFKRKKKARKEELDSSQDAIGPALDEPAMFVRFVELTGLMDVAGVSEEVRKGNMVVLDVSPLIQHGSESKLQLKRAVDQLRAVCFSVDGDIGQLGNRYVLLTPSRVKIWRDAASDDPSEEAPSQKD